jgi:exonuclease III
MSETMNPLFDNERELLERQKEEYKKALMGDVDQIKTQGQQIGKKVAIAGGVLVAGLLLRSLFTGDSKKKSKKLKQQKKAAQPLTHSTSDSGLVDYNSYIHEQEDDYTLSSERMPRAQHGTPTDTGMAKSFVNSDLMKVLTQQLTALLVVYLTKKVEEYLSSVSKNNDIAAMPIEVTEVETIAYTIPEEDAIRQTP